MDAATKQEWIEKRAKYLWELEPIPIIRGDDWDTLPEYRKRHLINCAASDMEFFESLLDAEVERAVKAAMSKSYTMQQMADALTGSRKLERRENTKKMVRVFEKYMRDVLGIDPKHQRAWQSVRAKYLESPKEAK